jgi:LemA protein
MLTFTSTFTSTCHDMKTHMRFRRWMAPLVLALALTTTGCGYNRIQTLDETVNKAKQNIGVQLQRRSDLIPNLVEVVKGFAKQESEVFTAIADARSRLAGAVTSGDLTQMAGATNQLNGALGRLLVITEAYPELKSNENFRALQEELSGTENRVAVARTDYNTAVNDYNTTIRKFPVNLTAKVMGMKAREYFELQTPGAEVAPKVDFSAPAKKTP